MQLDAFQEEQDEKDILDAHGMTEEGLEELMVRQLDRQISAIFLKTELFF